MLVSLPITAWSQDGVSFPDTAPQRGVSPIGSYTFDKLEAISKSTVLTYTIPLTTMPLGRGGMSIPINLVYNSAQFDYSYSYTYETSPPYSPILNQTLQTDPFGGWQVTAGYGIYTESRPLTSSENCNTGTGTQRSSLVMPDGSRHILQFYGFPQSFTGDGTGYYPWDYRGLSGCTNYTSLNGNVQTFTSDGSYIRVDASLNSGTWAAHLPDGTTVTNCTVSCSGGVPEQVIADRNANKITIQYFQTSSPYTLLTDDVGRTVKISAPPGDYSQITQTGYSGESLTWTFGPAPNSNGAAFTFQYICVPSTGTTCTEYSGGGGTDQLQVPSNDANNPLVYTFQYFPLSGLLQKVTLPTGATTTYSYQCSNYQKCFNGFLQNAVTSKQVVWYDQADGGNTQRVEDWSYSWSSSPAGHVLFTRVGPDGGKETSCMGAGPTGSFGVGSLATKIVQPNGDSVDYFYEGNRPYGIAYPQGASTVFNPWLAAEVHNIAASNGSGAESSISLYTADKNGNQLTAKTYDWAAYSSLSRDGDGVLTSLPTAPGSALLHSTQNSYTIGTSAQAGTGAESVADDANAYWNPASKKFLHLLSRSVLTGSGANSAATEFSYDINANPTQERHWDSTKAATLPASLTGSNAAVTSYVFDGYGNVTQATDPAGNVTKYTYDGNNLYVSQKVQAFSTNIARTFNYGWDFDSGLLTSKTDANNTITTSYSYDALGRPTNVTEDATHLARQTNTTYDDANRRVIVQHDQSKSTDGLLVSVTNYDQLGKVALIQELENASSQSATDLTAGIKVQTRYMYSSSNSYKLVSNPYREPNSGAASTACNNNFANCAMGWTLTTFDQSNRVVSTQALDGSGLPGPWGSNSNSFGTVSTSYDAQYTTVTDQAGNARKSAVDGVGRLVSVVEDPGHLNYSTTYSYDTLDNVTGVNQSGMTRSFVYDSLKRLSSVANPESGATYYAYDNDGNLVKKTDARNIATSYTYDALNRITSKAYSDGTPAVAYTYDGGSAVPLSAGRLIQTSNGISTTNVLGYDGLGEITASQQITEGQIYNFAYTYNLAGQLTSEMYPSGRVMNNSYDGAGRISEVFGGLGTTQTSYVSSPSYFPDGDPGSFVYGNSLARLFGYNSRLQVSYIWDAVGNNSNAFLFAAYPNWGSGNNNGNLQSAQTYAGGPGQLSSLTVFNDTYTYDGVNRLTGVYEAGGSNNQLYARYFGYDAYGNMWVTSNAGVPESGMTSNNNVYNSGNNRITGGSYDASGNQTAIGSYSTAYDAENRQTTVVDNTTQGQATYVYDGDGRRVQKVIQGGSITTYVYDAEDKLAAEYSSAGPPTNPCYTCYLSSDHLGSTRLVTDQNANVIARHDYLPFGEEVPGGVAGRGSQYDLADNVNQRFTGKERDSETGFDYFGARYFEGALGRFTGPDEPLADQDEEDPQSWNLYAYVRGNPLRNVDPDGRRCSFARGPKGQMIITDLDGQGCPELHDNTVRPDPDEAGLLMLQSVGENMASVHVWADVSRHGVEGAALVDAGLSLPALLRSLGKGLTALLNGGVDALLRDTEGLADAATAADPADKGGVLTKAGRALQKHAARTGSRFPQTAGSPTALNEDAQEIVRSVLSDPGKTAEFSQTGRFGKTLDIYGSNGQGLRYSADGKTFIGFIER